MNNINNFLHKTINEAKLNLWMVVDTENNVTYIVSAETLEDAKELVPSDNELIAWNITQLKAKDSRVLVDSDMIKSKGDKKYQF